MRRYVFFVLCILALGDAVAGQMPRSDSEKSPSTGIWVTRPSHPTVSKSRETVSAHGSHSATGSPTKYLKTAPTRIKTPKNSAKVPSTHRSHHRSTVGPATRSQRMPPSKSAIPRSSEKVPTGRPVPRASPKTSVSSTIGTISDQRLSRGSFPTSTKPPNSSPLEPAPAAATTTTDSTTTHDSTRTSTLVSATKTLTVSNGQTASAQVGWIVVGVGVGGSIAVEGNIIPVAGGTAGVIVANRGQDKLDPIDSSAIPTDTSSTPTTSTSTSKSSSGSTSRSTSSSRSSSTSSTARPTPYNIYPKLDSTPPEQSAFARDLERIAQSGSVRSITGVRDKLLLWVAALTPAQASELSRNPVVRGLNLDPSSPVNLEKATTSDSPSPNCATKNCSHRKRDGDIRMQQTILDELKMFSQAPGASLAELTGYAFDSMGGRGITVYVVDTGIDPNHREFINLQGSIRWLYLPNEPQTQSDEFGHGTCVASKVVGRTFGVAKHVNIVIVKLPPIDDMLSVSRVIAVWGIIANDVASNNLQSKAVVCNTLAVYPLSFAENDRTTYISSVGDIINLDVAFVTVSGNIDADAPGLELGSYPALLVNQLPIVVVGAVEPSGGVAYYSQGLATEVTVSAAGTVSCAALGGSTVRERGTSFAAPAVAGLAAYLMSLDQYRVQLLVPGSVARNVRDLIKSLGYARLPRRPTVVWNGIDSRQFQCPVRRDARSSECPAWNTTILFPTGHGILPGQSPKVTVTSSSSSPPPSVVSSQFTVPPISSVRIVTGLLATLSGDFNPQPSGITTILPTAIYESGFSLIISLATIEGSLTTTIL